MRFIILLAALILPGLLFAQKEDLIKYLEAYKSNEFEESKKTIADYSFEQKAEHTMSEYSGISGLVFETDIPSLKGFKAVVLCKLQNKAGVFVEKRMMVVMYFDKIKKHWSVYALREAADSNNSYEVFKKEVEDGKFYTQKEYVYRNLAYWSMMVGKIKDGEKYLMLAIDSAKENNNTDFFPSHTSIALKRIK